LVGANPEQVTKVQEFGIRKPFVNTLRSECIVLWLVIKTEELQMPFVVRARWDAEAGVWWAQSDDILGLVAEAETIELLKEDLRELVPELLKMNSQETSNTIDIHLITESEEDMSIAA
jgi:predicted RNase H-like HicB family nuclease